MKRRLQALALLATSIALPAAAGPRPLADELGRNEVRVYSAPHLLQVGRGVEASGLVEHLEIRGYRRVLGARPQHPGEYFWGHDVFWIRRRAHRLGGRDYPAALLGLDLRRDDGRILGWRAPGPEQPPPEAGRWLEPLLLAESLTELRASRRPVSLDALPEHVWRALLAAEDGRFFEHTGLDGRSLARAMLANARKGRVVQGGSTITQQLVKLRDLSPRRSLGRKVSEAVRALGLEAEHDKREILESYLNSVYYGHIDGVALYGIGAASRAYLGRDPEQLDLAQAAMFAAMVQGPNRLSPLRNPERVGTRLEWVLDRMETLGWATPDALRRARAAGLPGLRLKSPRAAGPRHLLEHLRQEWERNAPKRERRGRGVVLETTLDPVMQRAAERAVEASLDRLRRAHGRLRGAPLSAALVALDARSGALLAYVGGDPADLADRFDRVRRARRQPGSTVKPLVLLEAFEDCGPRAPLYPAREVSDRALTIELPSGPWSPRNPDGEFLQAVDLREAVVSSRNVPFVRVARWCGFEAVARRIARSGISIDADAPPSFVLGAIETTPLELAEAYTVIGGAGRRARPVAVRRAERPAGRRLRWPKSRSARIVSKETAFLVRDVLGDAAERGTARAAALDGARAFAKTGTSSGSRDAWLAGGAGHVVAVAWVGLDDDSRLGLGGAAAAAPLWREFMERTVQLRGAEAPQRPDGIVEHWIDLDSGLRLNGRRRGARRELFRRGDEPPRKRLLLPGRALPVIE